MLRLSANSGKEARDSFVIHTPERGRAIAQQLHSQHGAAGAPPHDEAERTLGELHRVIGAFRLGGSSGNRDRNLEPRGGGVGDLGGGSMRQKAR